MRICSFHEIQAKWWLTNGINTIYRCEQFNNGQCINIYSFRLTFENKQLIYILTFKCSVEWFRAVCECVRVHRPRNGINRVIWRHPFTPIDRSVECLNANAKSIRAIEDRTTKRKYFDCGIFTLSFSLDFGFDLTGIHWQSNHDGNHSEEATDIRAHTHSHIERAKSEKSTREQISRNKKIWEDVELWPLAVKANEKYHQVASKFIVSIWNFCFIFYFCNNAKMLSQSSLPLSTVTMASIDFVCVFKWMRERKRAQAHKTFNVRELQSNDRGEIHI